MAFLEGFDIDFLAAELSDSSLDAQVEAGNISQAVADAAKAARSGGGTEVSGEGQTAPSPEQLAELLRRGTISIDDFVRLMGSIHGQDATAAKATGEGILAAEQIPASGPRGQTTPDPLQALGTDPFLANEAFPRQVFGGFIQPQLGQLGGLASQTLRNQFGPSFQSFLLGLNPSEFGQEASSEGLFRNFLQGGNPILNPTQQAAGIQQVAGQISPDFEATDPRFPRQQFFNQDQDFFERARAGVLPFLNPLFRNTFFRAAQDQFDRFMFQNEEGTPFIQDLASRGGRFF